MDKRKSYFLTIDTETTNGFDDPIVYDIGGCIHTKDGEVMETFSFVIYEVFCGMKDLMQSAYYADKIPNYWEQIKNHSREIVNFYIIRKTLHDVCKKYNIKAIMAHNARFDYNALSTTQRYLTKSKYRWFFPYDTKFVCIWNMACNSVCQRGEYRTFAETNRHFSNHGKNYRATAETVYAFLTNNANFTEEHKGLDDVKIECEIFIKCFEEMGGVMGIKRNCWQKVKRGAIALR